MTRVAAARTAETRYTFSFRTLQRLSPYRSSGAPMPTRTQVRSWSIIASLAMTAAAAAQPPVSRPGTIIRGYVTGPDSLPLRGARVHARGPSDSALVSTLSDSLGGYILTLTSRDSAYSVFVQAIGMATHRGRVRRGATDTIEYSVRMVSRAAALASVSVSAEPIDAPPDE